MSCFVGQMCGGLSVLHVQKMCSMPEGTELLMEEGKDYPLLRCQNVYILPGVPQFMRQQLAHVGR
jgi:molybdopterin-biosynthesis enzyme MoeA-like protein